MKGIGRGAIPRQYIPAVEQGVRDAMIKGPLGFPVVDVAVTLIDGSYHTVDSSELAFRTAGRLAASDGLKACDSYILEPIDRLEEKITRLVSMVTQLRAEQAQPGGQEHALLLCRREDAGKPASRRERAAGPRAVAERYAGLAPVGSRSPQGHPLDGLCRKAGFARERLEPAMDADLDRCFRHAGQSRRLGHR
mgnify:CR=1 FL=1